MKQTVENLNVENKCVLVRVDYNVPMENGIITDTNKIEESLQTIKYLIGKGAKVILCSHLGRPKGVEEKYSLKPVAKKLSQLLRKKVIFSNDVAGKDTREKVKSLVSGQVMLMENLRFEKGETSNDEKFAKRLAKLADFYVNDAFGTAHRAHASTVGVASLLPNAVGFLMNKEISILTDALKNPERPFVAILGGSKVGDKISLVDSLLSTVNTLIIGGAMAFTFIKALGGNVGASLVEGDKLALANKLIAKAEKQKVRLLLPIDAICAKEKSEKAKTKRFNSFEIPENYIGFDIGPKSNKLFKKALKDAKTVIWNGPVGVFEMKKFEKGTKRLVKAVANVRGRTIIGGGDSGAAAKKFGYENAMTHISTGGGASLEFIEGKTLPGVDIIENIKAKN